MVCSAGRIKMTDGEVCRTADPCRQHHKHTISSNENWDLATQWPCPAPVPPVERETIKQIQVMASLVTDPAEADVSIIQMSCFPELLGYKEPGEGHGRALCEMWGNNVSSGKHVTFRLIYHHVKSRCGSRAFILRSSAPIFNINLCRSQSPHNITS